MKSSACRIPAHSHKGVCKAIGSVLPVPGFLSIAQCLCKARYRAHLHKHIGRHIRRHDGPTVQTRRVVPAGFKRIETGDKAEAIQPVGQPNGTRFKRRQNGFDKLLIAGALEIAFCGPANQCRLRPLWPDPCGTDKMRNLAVRARCRSKSSRRRGTGDRPFPPAPACENRVHRKCVG